MASTVGFLFLLCTSINPFVSILLLSLGQAMVPMISLACLALASPQKSIGTSFGILEILDGIVFIVGNTTFGLLYDFTGTYAWSVMIVFLCSLAGVVVLVIVEYRQLLPSEGKVDIKEAEVIETEMI